MALSAQHRSILYTEFVERLGPDVTEAFLAEFPAREGDEPITRDFLRAELSVTRGGLPRDGVTGWVRRRVPSEGS